jgi:hypothetical protein
LSTERALADDPAIRFVDLERQYLSIREEIDAAVLDAIASTQ